MNDEEQRKRFEEAAQQLECDESEEHFEQALKSISEAPSNSSAASKDPDSSDN